MTSGENPLKVLRGRDAWYLHNSRIPYRSSSEGTIPWRCGK